MFHKTVTGSNLTESLVKYSFELQTQKSITETIQLMLDFALHRSIKDTNNIEISKQFKKEHLQNQLAA